MDYAVENLEKTSSIERKATLNKLHNMQWLKNTSYSANPEKIKAVFYKRVQVQDEDKKIENKASKLAETIKIPEEPDKYSSTDDTCKTNLPDDTMPEKDDNIWNKDIDAANLFSNADKLASQKNEDDMLSIVESIVTAKLEAEFCTNKELEEQSSTSKNNIEDIVQEAVCTNLSDVQKIGGDTEELKLIKHSDGNNNDSKPITPRVPKGNDKQESTCKVNDTESKKASTEVKDKDAHVKTNHATKTSIKAGNNTNLFKDNEKTSNPGNDFKKTVSNSSKSLNTTEKSGRDYLNNKHNAKDTACIKKQEFVKPRNVSRNGIEKETKNGKPNFVKPGLETNDTACHGKNSSKDKTLQKPTTKQPKSKGHESLKKNAALNFPDDKNKTDKATYVPENFDSPLNESETKNEKVINDKSLQSDQRANRGVDFRKNTFVTQYKNSTFSKPMQNIPRTGPAPMYGRNSPHGYNPKFDRNRNRSAERRVTKKEHTPTNIFAKSNTGAGEFGASNFETCVIREKEIFQPTNVKSTNVLEVDASALNDKNDIDPVKVKTHLQSKKNMNDNTEQGSTLSEQYCEEISDVSTVNISQQQKEVNNEEIDRFKHASNLASDKCATDLQINAIQYSVKLENMQHTNDVTQLENSQTIWNLTPDNVVQKDATIMSLQQSVQNMSLNTPQTFAQTGNLTRQMSPWDSNNSKFYDQHSSVNDAMQLSQIPNIYNVSPYECTAQMPTDNNLIGTSTLENTMNSNRENSSVLYRYGPNVQQRPVMATDFPGNSMSSCQTNQVRWSSSMQDGFHIEHPYVATQPGMIHVYNPAAFGPDDFNNTHTMDYVSHPVIYSPSPYMQTWNSQFQYPVPILYNSPYTNYTTFPQNNQSSNFNNSMQDQQHKHNPYVQMNNYSRDTYNDTNIYSAQARSDNVPIKSNYYYKKYQDNNQAVYNVPQYVAPVSYSRSQQGMNFTPATGMNQYNASYCPPNQKYYKQNVTNYMKNPKGQIHDFVCDDNASEDTPPIISPKEFVTNNINLSNQPDQFATRVFKPEFKTKSSSGYRPPSSLPRYSGGYRRNTNFQDIPKEYTTYPVSIGRGTYKMKKT